MKFSDKLKAIRRASREIHKGMPRGGRQGTKKGKRGYSRHPKHPEVEEEEMKRYKFRSWDNGEDSSLAMEISIEALDADCAWGLYNHAHAGMWDCVEMVDDFGGKQKTLCANDKRARANGKRLP